jgi:hypothetical protein
MHSDNEKPIGQVSKTVIEIMNKFQKEGFLT